MSDFCIAYLFDQSDHSHLLQEIDILHQRFLLSSKLYAWLHLLIEIQWIKLNLQTTVQSWLQLR